MKLIPVCTALILLTFFSACKEEEDQLVTDTALIETYLADNNLTAEKTPEGVYYIINSEGTGTRPTIDDEVTVHYRGTLLDGRTFDSSYDRGETSTFPLANVIRGWQIGIPLFKEGGSGKLIIPSELAYGNNPPPGSIISRNEVLAFDIELFDVL